MSSSDTVNNLLDIRRASSKLPGKSEPALPVVKASAYFYDLGIGELGIRVIFSMHHLISLDRLRHVISVGIPPKIFGAIVEIAALSVTGFKSGRAWSNKGNQYKSVNLNGFRWHTWLADMRHQAPGVLMGMLFQYAREVYEIGITPASTDSNKRPHTALVADFVSGVIRNWLPNFGGGTIGVSHASSPFQNWCGESRLDADTSFGSFILA